MTAGTYPINDSTVLGSTITTAGKLQKISMTTAPAPGHHKTYHGTGGLPIAGSLCVSENNKTQLFNWDMIGVSPGVIFQAAAGHEIPFNTLVFNATIQGAVFSVVTI